MFLTNGEHRNIFNKEDHDSIIDLCNKNQQSEPQKIDESFTGHLGSQDLKLSQNIEKNQQNLIQKMQNGDILKEQTQSDENENEVQEIIQGTSKIEDSHIKLQKQQKQEEVQFENNSQESNNSSNYNKNKKYQNYNSLSIKYKNNQQQRGGISSNYRFSTKSRQNQSVYLKEQIMEKLEQENELLEQQQIEEKQRQIELRQQEKESNEMRLFLQRVKVRKFFNYIADNLESRRFKSLKEKHYTLLKEFNLKKKKIQSSRDFYSMIPKLNPGKFYIIFFDVLVVFVTLYMVFFSNLHLFFQYKQYEESYYSKTILWVLILFFLELLIRPNIGVKMQGKINYEPIKVWSKYKKKFLKQDLLTFVLLAVKYVLILQNQIQTEQFINFMYVFDVLIMFKLFSIKSIVKHLEHRIIVSGFQTHFLVLFKMLVQIMTMSHLIACCWYALQQYEINQNQRETWLEKEEFLNLLWYEKYIQCYYWSTATIMLIGTNGNTHLETLFANFILFFTVGIFAYVLENVAQTIKTITKDTNEYKENLQVLNKYMRNNNLDQETQVNVRQQLEFCYKSSQEININKQALTVLEKLPDNLSTKIRNQINSSIIKKFLPLIRNFSEKTITLSYQNPDLISQTSFVSQETIFQQNQQQEEIYMFLVLGGEVEIFYKGDEKDSYYQMHPVQKIQAGQLFGIESFFSGQVPKYSARCTQFTNICRIQRKSFINLLKYNQLEHEKFCTIKDEFCETGLTKYYNRPCILCSSFRHSEEYCNLVFYHPKRYKLFLVDKFQKTFLQERQRFFREDFLKKENPYYFIEINQYLNQHFNYKHQQEANQNMLYYMNYISQQIQMEYISDSDSEYDDDSSDSYDFQIPINKIDYKINNRRQSNMVSTNLNGRKSISITDQLVGNSRNKGKENSSPNGKKKKLMDTKFFIKSQTKQSLNQKLESLSENSSQSSQSEGDQSNKSQEKSNSQLEHSQLNKLNMGAMMKMFQDVVQKQIAQTTEAVQKKAQNQQIQFLGQLIMQQQQQSQQQQGQNQNGNGNQMQRPSLFINPQRSFRQSVLYNNLQGNNQNNNNNNGSEQHVQFQNVQPQNQQQQGGYNTANIQSQIYRQSQFYWSKNNRQTQFFKDNLFSEFDKQQEFDVYFTKYNLSNVLHNYLTKFNQGNYNNNDKSIKKSHNKLIGSKKQLYSGSPSTKLRNSKFKNQGNNSLSSDQYEIQTDTKLQQSIKTQNQRNSLQNKQQ